MKRVYYGPCIIYLIGQDIVYGPKFLVHLVLKDRPLNESLKTMHQIHGSSCRYYWSSSVLPYITAKTPTLRGSKVATYTYLEFRYLVASLAAPLPWACQRPAILSAANEQAVELLLTKDSLGSIGAVACGFRAVMGKG